MVVKNYGPILGTLNIRCRIIIGTQKGTTILITTHLSLGLESKQLSAAREDLKFWSLESGVQAFWGRALGV